MVKMEIPEASDIAAKWAEETPKRATYYEKNTPGKSAKWESNAGGASATYKSAVTAADIDKRFKGGIKGKAAKFARKVTAVGVARFGPGCSAAMDDMSTGMGPVVTDLKAIEIDARKPRGDPGNLTGRANKVASELNKKRLARLAAG